MKIITENNIAVKSPRRGELEVPIVYGIPNCDTIKKTLGWVTKNQIPFLFHDYKKAGITKKKLTVWCKQVRWESLVNKKSATWRGLPEDVQLKITNQAIAIKLMMGNTSIIKRPVIEIKNNLVIGFNENEYIRAFK